MQTVFSALEHGLLNLDVSGWRRALGDPVTLIALALGAMVWCLILLDRSSGTNLVQSLDPGPLTLWDWCLLGCLLPILEELAFRGFIQSALLKVPRLRAQVWVVSGANLLTSILFAFAHVFRGASVAMLVMVPSLVFGLLRERQHSVAGAVLVHVVYNLGLFAIFTLGP